MLVLLLEVLDRVFGSPPEVPTKAEPAIVLELSQILADPDQNLLSHIFRVDGLQSTIFAPQENLFPISLDEFSPCRFVMAAAPQAAQKTDVGRRL